MFLKKFWPAISWSILILLLVGLPGDVFPEIKSFWDWLSPDKVVHLFIFGTLSFLILYGFKNDLSGDEKNKYFSIAVIVTSLYGILTEVLQFYVFVGRSGNVFDALADIIGAIFGVILFSPIISVLKKIKLIKP